MMAGIEGLVCAIHRHLARRKVAGDPVGCEAARALRLLEGIPGPPAPLRPTGHPATRHLAAALSAATGDVAAALRSIAAALPWRYSYGPRTDGPDLGQDVAFAELVGPYAPFASDTVCLGLTLIGPRTLYPAHVHPAIELYCVVAGSATWTAHAESRRVPPGTFILHPSGVPHAMETGAEPLLAVYTWTGDVSVASTYTTG
jgi:mannose-6-phosphate isomerase-like protein (cupin superfamily)